MKKESLPLSKDKKKIVKFKNEEKEVVNYITVLKFIVFFFAGVLLFFIFKFAIGIDFFGKISNDMVGSGHLSLLAVSETGNTMRGSTADLYLEIREGDGSIYIDTFPLTKLDTQISNRFAKEMACNYLDVNCDNLNFYYRVRSNSAIIGGPSAGAAATALTIAILSGNQIDETVAITGTINSGGMIGVVGGVKQKIEAASSAGLRKVLVSGSDNFEIVINETGVNETINLIEYAKELNVSLIPVDTIDEVLYHMTNGVFPLKAERTVLENSAYLEEYKVIMKSVNDGLCEHTASLETEAFDIKNKSNRTVFSLERAKNYSIDAENEQKQNNYYSSASFCFSANNIYEHEIIKSKNLSKEDMDFMFGELSKQIESANKVLEEDSINTLTKLQAYLIVKERLIEADDYVGEGLKALDENNTEEAEKELSKGIERFYSVLLWNEFLEMSGEEFVIDELVMKKSCEQKIAEAEEKMQYAGLFIPFGLEDINKEILRSKQDYNEGNYKLCLFKASLAKANADNIISILAISGGNISTYIEKKLRIAENRIADNMNDGIFPILGFSYFEYSKSLHELNDYYSSSIYLEYALELSNFDMYFTKEDKQSTIVKSKVEYIIYCFLIVVFIFGIIVGMIISGSGSRKSK